jgi:hypothetical protein
LGILFNVQTLGVKMFEAHTLGKKNHVRLKHEKSKYYPIGAKKNFPQLYYKCE